MTRHRESDTQSGTGGQAGRERIGGLAGGAMPRNAWPYLALPRRASPRWPLEQAGGQAVDMPSAPGLALPGHTLTWQLLHWYPFLSLAHSPGCEQRAEGIGPARTVDRGCGSA